MFSSSYKSAVLKAIATCEAVAEGDFEARILNITEKGDAGRLLNAINRLIDRSDAYVRESRASLEYVSANKYFRRISEKGMAGAFGEASRTFNTAMDAMEGRFTDFSKVVDTFEDKMREIVEAVASAATELEASAQSMETATASAGRQAMTVASAAENASNNVNSVSAATEELTHSVGEINHQVTNSSKVTGDAVREVEVTNQEIAGLSRASEKIGDVLSLISDIADQTNLLALNATIEAARAGEAGKGFAVVASEVKNLASQTAKATEEIASQIAGIQTASTKAVTSIKAISKTVASVNEITSTISATVEEQGAATQEIAQNINQAATGTAEVSESINAIRDATGESGHAAGQVLEASRELAQKGEVLRAGVSGFLAEVRKAI
ncbi:Methyl-accepting chemotaxis protein [hydrothermal vent metagenome]|uniref:Methyl-accepting chemotaxis protein n=1 Tax=hydrothermal vent metagenome TaxID=652676 RepID=A0A3B0T8I2_9ZZZZ